MLSKITKPIWLLLILGFVLYFPTLQNGFVWDDEEQILQNATVHSISNLPQFFSGSTFNSGGSTAFLGLYFRPMMTTAFALIYTFFGPNAVVFHLFSIIIHIANAVLVYLILFYIFGKAKLNLSLPLIISLIFLVHPINTESTVYLAAYQDLLFFFFAAISFIFAIKGNKYSGLFILPSILSKETGAVFAVIIFFYLLFFERGKLKTFIYGVVISLGIYCWLRFGLAGIYFEKHGLTEISKISFWERMVNIPSMVMYYLGNFFLPINIAIDQQWIVKNINVRDFILPVSLIATFIYFYKKSQKIFLFFLFWFILSLGFHLQIFPLDMTVSDRWFYLSSVSLITLIVLVFDFSPLKKYLIPVFILILMLLSLRTWIREFDWKDGLTLYSRDVKYSKNAFDLENNLGVELARIGDFKNAKIQFAKSVELKPDWWVNWNNLGVMIENEGDLDGAKNAYLNSMKYGVYYRAYQNYARLLINQGKTAEAKEFLEKDALIKLPNNPTLRQLQYKLYNQK